MMLVLRAMLGKGWIEKRTRTILSGAFFLRPNDDGKLSVSPSPIQPATALAEAAPLIARRFNKCFGVGSLLVGAVHDLGLRVGPDPLPGDPDHHAIIGLPLKEDDPTEAERLAGQLAKLCRLVWDNPSGIVLTDETDR